MSYDIFTFMIISYDQTLLIAASIITKKVKVPEKMYHLFNCLDYFSQKMIVSNREDGILPLAVGVANYNQLQLLDIVGNNSMLIFEVADFDDLVNYASNISEVICTSGLPLWIWLLGIVRKFTRHR